MVRMIRAGLLSSLSGVPWAWSLGPGQEGVRGLPVPADPQAAPDIGAGGRAPRLWLLCPGEPGGRLGHHHPGVQWVQRWGLAVVPKVTP